jgi:hypothetical protein
MLNQLFQYPLEVMAQAQLSHRYRPYDCQVLEILLRSHVKTCSGTHRACHLTATLDDFFIALFVV